MRFREKDVATTSGTILRSWSENGRYLANYTEQYTRTSRSVRMLDVVTPSFHRERNKGGIICSPMFSDEIYHDVTPTSFVAEGIGGGSVAVVYKSATFKGLDDVSPNAGITSSGGSSVMDEQFKQFSRETSLAITRAHADVNLSEINVLASAGELPETVAWIRNCVQRVLTITKVFRAKREVKAVLRKLRYNASESTDVFHVKRLERYLKILETRKARKASAKKSSIDDTVFNLWLEYRYAVRPLIGDIQNAIRAIDAQLSNKRLVARGKELVVGETLSKRIVDPTNHNSNSVGVVATVKAQTSVNARAGCLYTVDANLASMLDILGFDQPLEALWELTRFSFVLDWVFSIGDLLESWFKSSGLSILTSWVTLQVEHTQTCRVISAELYPEEVNTWVRWPNQQFVLGSSHSVVRRRWRYPNPALPLLPRFDLKINLAKLIDLGAIARGITSGQKVPVVVRRS